MGRADKDVAAEEAAASRRKLGLLRSLVSNGDSSASTVRKSARAANPLGRDVNGRGRSAPRSRPVVAGGPASHILGWLGRPERPTPKPERQDRPERQEKSQLQMVGTRRKEVQSDTSPEAPPKKMRLNSGSQSAQATSRLMAQANAKPLATSRLQSTKPKVPVRKRTVNALKMGEETMLRNASPCSSESPGRSSSAEKNPGLDRQGARSSSRSHSRSSRSTTPSERARSVSINKDAGDAVTDSLVDEVGSTRGGFQQVVLDQLRILCKEYEGAEVLAEYIVAMVAGNKGRGDIASELEPFFKDAAQATSFAGWVEEVKVKFLTGGPLPGMGSSPPKATNALGAGNSGNAFGPHVAVTKRAVLQPSPSFNADPATAVSVSASLAPQNRVASVVTAPRPVVRASKLVGSSVMISKPGDKKHLLENMTRQLQAILTKLNDPDMKDETREKYQALAQSVQTQMAKITRPPPPSRALPPRGRRR